jgi:Ca-activated chloride channel homolog
MHPTNRISPLLCVAVALALAALPTRGDDLTRPSLLKAEESAKQSDQEHFSFVGTKNILFVLDCTYSMREALYFSPEPKQKRQKFEIAKRLISGILASIPPTTCCGLREIGFKTVDDTRADLNSYSNSFMGQPTVECRVTELLVPIGPENRKTIIAAMNKTQPVGKLTPLEFTLSQIFEKDLSSVQGRTLVILLTDGADTCGGHPCRFLTKGLPSLTADIVVVSLLDGHDRLALKELRCLAETGQGKYYDLDSFDSLIQDVQEIGSPRSSEQR